LAELSQMNAPWGLGCAANATTAELRLQGFSQRSAAAKRSYEYPANEFDMCGVRGKTLFLSD
jgi:hypothetical protein